MLASACKTLPAKSAAGTVACTVEGVPNTEAVVLLHCAQAPKSVRLVGEPLTTFTHSHADGLLWVRFPNTASPRELSVSF